MHSNEESVNDHCEWAGTTHPTSVETADVFGDSAHLLSSLSALQYQSPFVDIKAICLKLTLMVPPISQMIIKININDKHSLS